MGGEFSLTTELRSPNGVETVTNTVLAGYPLAVGIVAQKAVLPPSQEIGNAAQELLYRESLNYIETWNQAEDELAALLKVAVVRPIPTVVNMGGVLDVTSLLGEPQGVEWKGLFIDADLRAAEPVSTVLADDARETTFMELAALQGSDLENKVFEADFGVESISTAKLFGIANDNRIPTQVIEAANVDLILPTLPFAANVKSDIAQAVSAGYRVRIPQSPVTYVNWTGVGYIKENPVTGEAGYMLSGTIAGGATVLGFGGLAGELPAEPDSPIYRGAQYRPDESIQNQRGHPLGNQALNRRREDERTAHGPGPG